MSLALIMASALVGQVPIANETTVEVAYPEMRDGRSMAAIQKIEHADARDADHPARLINLGVAFARVGQVDKARAMFDAAAGAERFRLETASGDWIDSRTLAREAIAMLENGDFNAPRFAAR